MAEHGMLGRHAAIKILHPAYSTQHDIVTRFFNEARAATAISDPGIIQIFDFGFHTDGSAYIVMELLDGEPLDRRLRHHGALAVGEALHICRQVASAVGAAHARGIVHRDLKPENIFLVRDREVAGGERAKVLDFGIAKLIGDLGARQKTNTSAIMGTPHYMSPEQCRGAGKVDQRSDVYSLGCVLFTLVTGHVPFDAEGAGDLIVKHLIAPPPRPSEHATGLPAAVDELILRCLAKDPSERFASSTELATALDDLLKQPSIASTGRLAPTRSPPPPTTTTLSSSAASVAAPRGALYRRLRGKLYAGVGLLLASSAIVVIAASQGSPEQVAGPFPISPPSPIESQLATAKTDIREILSAFSRWAASHVGAPCPTSTSIGGRADPWGHPYELTCTDQPADQIIGVRSSGPDGRVGTHDDLTSWSMGPDLIDLARGKRWTTTVVTAQPPPPDQPPVEFAAPKQAPPPKKPSTQSPRRPAPPESTLDFDGDGIPDVR